MRYVPFLVMGIGLVIVMAGGGQRGVRAGGTVALVVIGFIVLALLFAFVVKISS